jgi:16S rRNA (cytosine1402-N4)-methyltransferase
MGWGADMEEMAFHRPVLLREAVEQLEVRPGGVYVDATVGEGGHASAVLVASAPDGVVLGIDRDPRSLSYTRQRLSEYGQRFIGVAGNYADMVDLARQAGLARVDGVLLDLGFSSRQVDGEGYGFSFQRDEPLDMRYDPDSQDLTAAQVVDSYAEADLARLFFQYGEEPRARAMARLIVQNRPLATTGELAELVSRVGRPGPRGRRQVHPATRVFQALRIEVNQELANLERGLAAAVELLNPSGRVVVISYHSLEDRLVKNTLAQQAALCICPPELPQCVCRHRPALRLVTRRIIRPTPEEVSENPRSRSARMRVAQKL